MKNHVVVWLIDSVFTVIASDLADLLETIHVVVRLMENLQARGTLRVCPILLRTTIGEGGKKCQNISK